MTTFTTLREIKAAGPCKSGWLKLTKSLGGIRKFGLDAPLSIRAILDSNGENGALWAISNCSSLDSLRDDYSAKLDSLCDDFLAKRNTLCADHLAKCNSLYADHLEKRNSLLSQVIQDTEVANERANGRES